MTPSTPPSPRAGSRVRRRGSASRRRGSVYVLVLGVSTIVLVIGMSALAAVRIQHQGTQSREDAAQAQQLADDALRIVFARLRADADWRTTETHDAWSTVESTGDGFFRYRLVDQVDTDLANDDTHAVRLYTRATQGDAVRLSSILLASVSGQVLGPELVTNGDAEAGTTGFSAVSSGTVSAYTDTPHAGTTYLQHEGRSTALSSWKQDLPGLLESGKTYRVAAWFRLEDAPETVKLGLSYPNGLILRWKETSAAATNTGWTLVQDDLTPDFSSTPTDMYVYGVTTTNNQDVHFDDVSVREVVDGYVPAVVRGSYRQELDF